MHGWWTGTRIFILHLVWGWEISLFTCAQGFKEISSWCIRFSTYLIHQMVISTLICVKCTFTKAQNRRHTIKQLSKFTFISVVTVHLNWNPKIFWAESFFPYEPRGMLNNEREQCARLIGEDDWDWVWRNVSCIVWVVWFLVQCLQRGES